MSRIVSIDEALRNHPELGLLRISADAFVYHCGQTEISVTEQDAQCYIRTYDYCRALVKADRYDAAKDIAFSRSQYNQLPFDRLPFLALLNDPAHLIDVVRDERRLQIVPEIKGKRVNFFYEEGHRHQHVRPLFVGTHLRNNSLCNEDVKHRDYERAIFRAMKTPLSSELICSYDAHMQCEMMIKDFDAQSAVRLSNSQHLQRNIGQEWRDFAMPLAQRFREIYQHQSLIAAKIFAKENGFTPVIRDNTLITLKKYQPTTAFQGSGLIAGVPILNYSINEIANLESSDNTRFWH